MSKDSYWKRWRRHHAAAQALALESSSEDEMYPYEQVENSNTTGTGEQEVAENSGNSNDETSIYECLPGSSDCDSSYDFGFSETVQSSSDSDSEEDREDEGKTIREKLASWTTTHRLSKSCVDELLQILRPAVTEDIPKDSRTLLQTPKTIRFEEKCGGQYIYFGLENGLTRILNSKSVSSDSSSLRLNFNIDGIPLFKSSGTQFWPILCSFRNLTPFIVALFYGTGKPSPLENYLEEFLSEVHELSLSGITVGDRVYNVLINAFICDAPARAYLKNIIGHTGYNACERCSVQGYWKQNRIVLHSDNRCPLRSDEKFSNLEYRGHQKGETPLILHNIPCVTAFPLDYMHLVCLGIVKRILWFLRQGPAACKLSANQLGEISNSLVYFTGKLPSEFARQPRTLVDLERWKATEFRQFLLYTGPVVLRKFLRKEMYEHFLSLTVAISILLQSDDGVRTAYLDYAEELLQFFVQKSKDFYTELFIVYNVHSVIHLPDDCRHFNCSLNDVSSFPFENYLHSIKKSVRSAKNPIVQVAKRIDERNRAEVTDVKPKRTFSSVSTQERNRCFLLKDESYAFVKEKRANRTLVCDICNQDQTENYFTRPCESTLINIALLKPHQRMSRRLIEQKELEKKVVCLPTDRGYVLIPMLHSLEN